MFEKRIKSLRLELEETAQPPQSFNDKFYFFWNRSIASSFDLASIEKIWKEVFVQDRDKKMKAQIRKYMNLVTESGTYGAKIPSKVGRTKYKYVIRQNISKHLVENVAKQISKEVYKSKKRRGKQVILKTSPSVHDAMDQKIEEFKQYLLDNSQVRDMPTKEANACKRIVDVVNNVLPPGGSGMMIGTQAPFSVSTVSTYPYVSSDNLEVALSVRSTTDVPPVMIIGSGVSEEKALFKVGMWSVLNSTKDFKYIVSVVDRVSFTHFVTKEAEKDRTALLKVILMASGPWKGDPQTLKRRELDLNFKNPSEFLTQQYPNLHIVAMVMDAACRGFIVRHIHRGNVTDY